MPKLSTLWNFGKHFARCYVATAPALAYRLTLSTLLEPKGSLELMHVWLDWVDRYHDDPVLDSAEITEILPGNEDVMLEGPYQISSTAETRVLLEIASVAHVIRALNPALVFEFGTFIGRMTRLLARNAPRAEVLTLDLPQDQVRHIVGGDYANRPEASRITQLSGDSTKMDYAPWAGRCDFVWVDACHDYPYVVADTRNAIKLCKPGAWIAWHDYHHRMNWLGVTRALREMRNEFETIKHVRGTTIVLAKMRA